jgi:uncharacterized membrane protein YphA (DoxX/SURF4 family)
VIGRWERWWFPPDSGFDLAVCRILVVGAQLFVFVPFFATTPSEHVALIEHAGAFDHPQWMIRLVAAAIPFDVAVWSRLVRAVHAVTLGAGLTTLVGLWTRPSALIFALGTWFLASHDGSYGEVRHTEIVLSLFLLFLAISPSGRHLSLDARRRGLPDAPTDAAVWPLKLTQLLLAWSYFSNGFAKLFSSGVGWMNGYTLQENVLYASMQWDRPLGLWLAQQHELCVVLSIATIAFELVFPLAVFAPRARPLLLFSGVVFHVVTYLTMNVGFFQHIALYAVFVDFERPAARARTARSRYAPARSTPREQ